MALPDHIITKKGELTETEWEIVKQHPRLAGELLKMIPFLENATHIPYYHHEWWDGSGYPEGLAGEDIPLPARIFAIADVWDSLSSDRPYREAWPPEKVLAYIQDHTGTHFDPRVVETFLGLLMESDLISPKE
jgi:HD-GYP domain-containing protein (c-di-GMP phosphodiesterase class II)